MKMGKVYRFIAILPVTAGVRGKIYRFFSGWGKIGKNFKIGFGSYIDTEQICIGENIVIGNMVRIKYLDKFEMGDNSSIGSSTIICGSCEANKFTERNFICGKNVDILCSHYFDVVAPVEIGDNVTIAGKWTQFYTHSFDLIRNRLDGSIKIGNNVYIGAGCLINLGVNICNEVVLQGGTCVNKSICESGVYSSNNIYKRGEIRQYDKIFKENKSEQLMSGVKVFYKSR